MICKRKSKRPLPSEPRCKYVPLMSRILLPPFSIKINTEISWNVLIHCHSTALPIFNLSIFRVLFLSKLEKKFRYHTYTGLWKNDKRRKNSMKIDNHFLPNPRNESPDWILSIRIDHHWYCLTLLLNVSKNQILFFADTLMKI